MAPETTRDAINALQVIENEREKDGKNSRHNDEKIGNGDETVHSSSSVDSSMKTVGANKCDEFVTWFRIEMTIDCMLCTE